MTAFSKKKSKELSASSAKSTVAETVAMASKTVRDAQNQKKRKNPTDWNLPSGMVKGKRTSKRQGHRHAAPTEVTAAAASSSSAAAQSPPKVQVEVTEANMDAIILDAVRDYMRSDLSLIHI